MKLLTLKALEFIWFVLNYNQPHKKQADHLRTKPEFQICSEKIGKLAAAMFSFDAEISNTM